MSMILEGMPTFPIIPYKASLYRVSKADLKLINCMERDLILFEFL